MSIGNVNLLDLSSGDLIVFRCGISEVVHSVSVYEDKSYIDIFLNGYAGLKYRVALNGQHQCADPHPLDIIRIYKSNERIDDLLKKMANMKTILESVVGGENKGVL